MAALALAGFFLRFRGAAAYWLNPDEGMFLYAADRATLPAMLQAVNFQGHPPLFYLLLRGMLLFSGDVAWLRLLPVAAGTAAIPVAWHLARGAGGAAAGLAAAAIMAFAPGAVTVSQLLRPYALLVLWLLSAFRHLSRYLERRAARDLALYALFLCLALVTHYSATVVLAGLGLFLLVLLAGGAFSRREVPALAAAHAPSLVLAAALYAWQFAPRGSPAAAIPSMRFLSEWYIRRPSDAWRLTIAALGYMYGAKAAWAALAGIAAGLVLARRRGESAAWGLPLSVLAAALLFSLAGWYPYGGSRHSVYLLACLTVPLAVAAGRLFSLRRWALAAGGLALAALLVWSAGSARHPARPPSELTVRLEDYLKVLPSLEGLSAGPGAVIVDQQTFFVLHRLFGGADWDYGREFRDFPWGGRTVYACRDWRFIAGRRGLDRRNHLANVVRRLDRGYPGAILRPGLDVRVAFAGWEEPVTRSVREIGRPGIMSDVAEAGNIGSFRLDVGAYLRAVEGMAAPAPAAGGDLGSYSRP